MTTRVFIDAACLAPVVLSLFIVGGFTSTTEAQQLANSTCVAGDYLSVSYSLLEANATNCQGAATSSTVAACATTRAQCLALPFTGTGTGAQCADGVAACAKEFVNCILAVVTNTSDTNDLCVYLRFGLRPAILAVEAGQNYTDSTLQRSCYHTMCRIYQKP